MKWYKVAYEAGHGDTLNGQYMNRELNRIAKELDRLRTSAQVGGPEDVLPRWRGDVRRRILMLPTREVISRMSMYELEQVSGEIDDILGTMAKFSVKRFKEIVNAN